MKKLLFGVILSCVTLFAAEVSNVRIKSPSMEKEIGVAIMLPDTYTTETQAHYPVVYFLDGAGGNGVRLFNTNDTRHLAQVFKQCDELKIIMVVAGCSDKWYFDSPVDSKVRWQQFLTKELIGYMDANYRTVAAREGRAITGLSMGGHGALYTAFTNPELFIAAGSTSGGVDFRAFPKNWGLPGVLGTIEEHPENWEKGVVVNNLSKLPNANLAIYFDCGSSDFFLACNRNLAELLAKMKVKYTYLESPGGHSHPYWCEHFPMQVAFFNKYLKH